MSATKIIADFLLSVIAKALIYAAFLIPYRLRLYLFGMFFRRVVGVLSGNIKRAERNLRFVYPERPPHERARIARASLDNVGRTIIEIFSVRNFRTRAQNWRASGPGLEALEKARREGQAIILITGHFANFAATGTYLAQKGFNVTSLYRPLNNRFLDGFYHRSICALANGSYARGRDGFRQMHKHLKNKGAFLIFADQYIAQGEELDFLGKPTMTALSPAKIALKHNALFVPNYAIRAKDGIGFELIFEAPIPPSTPEAMMQRFNDSLGAHVKCHPEQWLWMHKRWKPQRDIKRRAARITPKGAS